MRRWETALHFTGTPRLPTLAEAIAEKLSPEAAARHIAHVRLIVEEGRATSRGATAYLWARKG